MELIGVMVRNRQEQFRMLRILRKFTTKRTKLFTFLPTSINWRSRTILGLHYLNRKYRIRIFPFPDAIYNCYYGDSGVLHRLEKIMGDKAIFNNVTRFDKPHLYILLRETEVIRYLPETLFFCDIHFDQMLDKYGTIYLKPSSGSRGKGVFRVEKGANGEFRFAEHHFAPQLITTERVVLTSEVFRRIGIKPYIVQQGIAFLQKDGRNFDIRVLVQKNRTASWHITNLVSRVAFEGYYNTSICEYIRTSEELLREILPIEQVSEIIESIKTVSLQIAQSIESAGGILLGEISVDFGLDQQGHLWIIEINGHPQKSIYENSNTLHEAYANPIHYAKFLAKLKPPPRRRRHKV